MTHQPPPASDESASTSESEAAALPERKLTLQDALEMAQGFQRKEQYAEAEEIYLQLLGQLPDEPNVLNFFGVLRHQQGRRNEALGLLERAVTVAPDAPGPWINLANVLIEAGYHDDAVKALNNVIILAPGYAHGYNNLGILHMRRGEFDLAEAALKRALEQHPDLSYVHYNLARNYFSAGRIAESAAHALRSRSSPKARQLLSRSLFLLGEREKGLQVLEEWVAEEPGSAEAAHYLAAARGTNPPERASDAYVAHLFDGFAASFDVQLESLNYKAPQYVCDELARLRAGMPAAVILDAGCGTGLCAPLLRPMASWLEGVDLSSGMLERARARSGYDALHHAELTAFLDSRPDTYDVVVSADVLIYFGDLDGVMRAVHRALRPQGVLVATLEVLADDTRDHALEVHGRYVHSETYLRKVLARNGLELTHLDAQVLRTELLDRVMGWVFSAVKVEPGGAAAG